ncbi:hypothetical protein HDV01_003605 [Terramyces sp. JEL0728]|nr:hypothetical protein HDV01_003605 [Terramyces sp. JEL0728]
MTGFTMKELLPRVTGKEWDSKWDNTAAPESKSQLTIYLLNGYNKETFTYTQKTLEHQGFKIVKYLSTSYAHLPLGVATQVDPLSEQELFTKYFKRIDNGQEIGGKLQQAIVIITDSNTIEYCICRGIQIPPRSFDLPNGSITEVSIVDFGWVRVMKLGDTSPMEIY